LSPVILLNSKGKAWTSHGFSSSWRKTCKKAGVAGVTFNDLRGTFVTRAALNNCTEAEIAYVTGHTIGQVRSILDKHYLHRDPSLAKTSSGSAKGARKMQTALQTAQLKAASKGQKDE
jgi:integrase